MKIFIIIGLFFSSVVGANTMPGVVAKVTGTGTYATGAIYVFFDRTISSCNTVGRLDLSADNPAKDQVLSIAMTACASGASVKVHPGTCNGTRPEFGVTGDSYFHLTK